MAPKGKGVKKTDKEVDPQRLRIAIVAADRCKPKKCRQECKRHCPVVKSGKLCVEVTPTDKISWISEALCIGCNICVKRCPFEAINIVNLPKDLESQSMHRYSANSFKLHRLPTPRPGQVLGLVGTNGIGKSTSLRILSGKLKPNLGRFKTPPEWIELLESFRGSELQSYFQRILNADIKALTKPQYVDNIAKQVKGRVGDIIKAKDDEGRGENIIDALQLRHLLTRQVSELSGGELQRFAIAVVAVQKAEVYMFDEPSSYLDIKQRMIAANVIRGIVRADNYVIVVEHDLAVLDYMSDFVSVLWGDPGKYGVVSHPASVRDGINMFLDGFLPMENMRTRAEPLNFKLSLDDTELGADSFVTQYPAMTKKLGNFEISVQPGQFASSEITVLLGENGTGKSTFIRMLAGLLKPDNDVDNPILSISYKPQTIAPKFPGSVRDLFLTKIREAFNHALFQNEVIKQMAVNHLLDMQVTTLSGGELQRVALCIALGKPADVYLIDEPSAYLDSEQRVAVAKVIKRYIMSSKKSAFIVEHDFIMATYLADRIIVYEGQPGIKCVAKAPQGMSDGMNNFLKNIETTFRRDPTNFRPRINKLESQKDKEQKNSGNYFADEKD